MLSRTFLISLASFFATVAVSPARADHKDKVANWPESCKKANDEMTSKYGEPQGMTPTRLVWTGKGPYLEIILLNEEYEHDFPVQHKDCLEHVVAYKVPAEKEGDLAKFDGSVIVDRTRGTLGARCDSEAHNLIALNLANDIITGKKNVEQARQSYADLVKQEKGGSMPSYGKDLQFQPVPLAQTGDKDMPLAAAQATVGAVNTNEAQPAAAQQPAADQQRQQSEQRPNR